MRNFIIASSKLGVKSSFRIVDGLLQIVDRNNSFLFFFFLGINRKALKIFEE